MPQHEAEIVGDSNAGGQIGKAATLILEISSRSNATHLAFSFSACPRPQFRFMPFRRSKEIQWSITKERCCALTKPKVPAAGFSLADMLGRWPLRYWKRRSTRWGEGAVSPGLRLSAAQDWALCRDRPRQSLVARRLDASAGIAVSCRMKLTISARSRKRRPPQVHSFHYYNSQIRVKALGEVSQTERHTNEKSYDAQNRIHRRSGRARKRCRLDRCIGTKWWRWRWPWCWWNWWRSYGWRIWRCW
jgi:hypothetical protein